MLIAFMVLMICITAITRRTSKPAYLYEATNAMTAPEQVLYHKLITTFPQKIVLAQVGLSRVIKPQRGQKWIAAFRTISQKSLDFVICEQDSHVTAAIELDDSTHLKKDRQASDQVKDAALQSAGIRIIRWNVKNIPDIASIQHEVLNSKNQSSQKRRAG